MHIYLDEETVGTNNLNVIAEIAATIEPPGNMSKPETIAAWEAEKKPALVAEAVSRTALDGAMGRICCIGWAVNEDQPRTCCGADEREVLMEFFAAVAEIESRSRYMAGAGALCWVGHNIHAFDLRILLQRAMVNGIQPPRSIPFDAKPWGERVYDTMLKWNPEHGRRISLVNLCRALGIPSSKGSMNGSRVGELFRAGQFGEISSYCRGDVADVRNCHRQMAFLGDA